MMRVGFIGPGHQGAPMALRIVESGGLRACGGP
jgi:3-hydroxyisobutyrate dehydrogenase-like beta-hydroxyacid dehydrogenase